MNRPLDRKTYSQFVQEHFGLLTAGAHASDGAACLLESYSQWLDVEWTDDPWTLGLWDLRPLNDAAWSSDDARTDAMIILLCAYARSSYWPVTKQLAVVQSLAIGTVKHLVSRLSMIPEAIRLQCSKVET
ncbi:MAG: hypothetical protein ACR2P5_02840, partial [Gammaproteobacteria bacterium]